MEWNRNQVLRLVELYRSQPALWDTSDPRFKDRQAKRWSLMTIASQMSLPPIDIEKKIHCLRTQFNREYLKMKTSARRPTWFAYQPLAFVLRNKHDVGLPDDISQWKAGTITVKEEFLDEYDGDDVEMRLTVDENPNINFVMKDNEINEDNLAVIADDNNSCSNTNNSNFIPNNRSDKDNRDNNDLSSDNEMESSSAVQVILRESNSNDEHRIKRICKSDNNVTSNNSKESSVSASKSIQQAKNTWNNGNSNNDELAVFGTLLTDELLKVNDYYTLQLAKYEISKIIFQATTGGYDKTSTIDHYNDDYKWKSYKRKGDIEKTSLDSSRMSSSNELKTFSAVIVNELRTIGNNYSLQVAKFCINRVIFHSTTAGIVFIDSTSTDVTGATENQLPIKCSD